MPTPLERYRRDLQRPNFIADPAQGRAVQHIQRLFDELQRTPASETLWTRAKARVLGAGNKAAPVRGLYLWGGVGRGKTYLADNFFACLPFEDKLRVHFHRFMRRIHEELKTLKDVRAPLSTVARRLKQKARVLCLDEFSVNDIADAMLLSGLLRAMFDEGMTLVATSNTPPDDLYKSGLQRERFIPAIHLMKRHLDVVNVDNGVDYRLRELERAPIYYHPLDATSGVLMRAAFDRLAPDEGAWGQVLTINGREIPTICCADGVVWLDFEVLCNVPRSVDDYIELAQCYNTVLLSNVPRLDETKEDFAHRLVNLVDEFYDRNVKLIISAAAAPEALYSGSKVASAFQRTVSRLKEMHSHAYLERPHLP